MRDSITTLKWTAAAAIAILSGQQMQAQSYNYTNESFEEPVWSTAADNPTTIVAATGAWSTARDNVQVSDPAGNTGDYCLMFKRKDPLVSPLLEKGVNTLVYYAKKTSSRTIYAETSVDKVTWTTIDTYAATDAWVKRSVMVNDPTVRYVRFRTNSNGGLYIDDVTISDAGTADVKVTTEAVSDISQESATLRGSYTATGAMEIEQAGFCYNTQGMPDVKSDIVEATLGGTTFTALLQGLAPETTYYVRAFVTTAGGTNYGDEQTFETRGNDDPISYWTQPFANTAYFPTSSPTEPVSIDVPEQGEWIYYLAYKDSNEKYIVDGSAYSLRVMRSGGYVITPLLSDGVTRLTFNESRKGREITVYTSEDGGATWTLLTTFETDDSGMNTVKIGSRSVNRIKLLNATGGEMNLDNIAVTVYPSGIKPTVETGSAESIGRNTALLSGQILTEGEKAVIERGICWSLSATPLIADHKTVSEADDATFRLEIGSLPAGRTIYYRAFATSRAGTGYGEVKSFATIAAVAPTVATLSASHITGESATTGGRIDDQGGAEITMRGICYGHNDTPTMADNCLLTDSTTAEYVLTLTGLSESTPYFYRAFAVNEAGTGYGEVFTFTTGIVAPAGVETGEITDICSYKAQGGGRLTDDGNGYTRCGLCWNTTGAPTIDDAKIVCTDKTGETFAGSMTNLCGGTLYYVRAFAVNGAGVTYGNEETFTTSEAHAYFVTPAGNDETGDGTEAAPFYSLQKAVDLVAAGDSIIMAGGTYHYTARINIRTCGETDGGTITLTTRPGERALLDFSAMPLDDNNQGIRLSGSYWYFYGLDIMGAGDNGMLIERNKPVGGSYVDVMNNVGEAHDNTIEFCTFYKNQDTGLQMKNMAAHNRVINCDAYFNCDPDMGDADGFAPKLTVGTGNYFYGCRAWNNSDDGWDGLLTATENGFPDDVTTTIENCWAFNNGFLADGSESKGNGNGFKMGGNYERHNFILRRCLAFDNLMKGFDQNHNTGNMTLINCTGYSAKYNNKSHYTYKIDATTLAEGKKLTLINCVAIWDGLIQTKSLYGGCDLVGGDRTTCDFLTSPADYVSIQPLGVTAPRKADGSLPDIDFMKIAPGNSKLIDKGIAFEGIAFEGQAPDLGCFETSVETAITTVTERTDEPIAITAMGGGSYVITLQVGSETDSNTFSVLDMAGRELHRQTICGNSLRLSATGLTASDAYIVRIIDHSMQQTFARKIMIRK